MGVVRDKRPERRLRMGSLSYYAIAPSVLASLPLGRLALLLVASGVVVLFVLVAIVALGAAFAPQAHTRRSAARILDQLLRLAPWYTSRR
ncbi:hypothetical protein [Nonomuraea glycinis]|uniref:hypothetical protein n=1 Tax=Nonomuraea glycinis TaxID=2047744 RepID=UPI0033ADBC34